MLPIIILNIVSLFFVMLKLPDIVPNHIGLNMQIDGYGSKWTLMFLGIIPLIIYFSMKISISNKLKADENYNYKNETIISTLSTILVIFLNWIFVLLGFQNKVGESTVISFPMEFLIIFLMGLFIMITSNYFGTIKLNHVIGIRTPWTLSSSYNWKKTHRLAGYTGIIGGLIMCVFSVFGLLTHIRIYSVIGITFGLALFVVVPIIYSFVLYKNKHDNGND